VVHELYRSETAGKSLNPGCGANVFIRRSRNGMAGIRVLFPPTFPPRWARTI